LSARFGLVLLALVLGVSALGCGQGESDPPWGLEGAPMPRTEAQIMAVYETMGEVEGRQPSVSKDYGMVYYEGKESEAPGIYRSISALPADSPITDDLMSMVEEPIAEAENSDTMTVVASNLDRSSDLAWAVIDDLETDDGLAAYSIVWTDGSWLFFASGDTPEFRVALVQEFVEASSEVFETD